MSGPMNVPWLASGASEEGFRKALYGLHSQVLDALDDIVISQCGGDNEGQHAAYLAWAMEMFARSLVLTVPTVLTAALASGVTKQGLAEMFAMDADEFDAKFPGVDRMLEAQLLANVTGQDVEVTVQTRDLGPMDFPLLPRTTD